jgi:AraC-like DNA-binding protein
MPISILFVRALIDALEHYGIPRDRFLASGPIDAVRLNQPDARLDVGEFDALLERAIQLTGDEAFGLRMGEMADAGNYNLAAHLVAHATTLRDGIASLLRFHKLLLDRPSWRFVEDARTATLLYDATPGSANAVRFRSELTMSGFYRLLKYFERRCQPRLVAFAYRPPPYRAEYSRIFEGTERFSQSFTGILFDRNLLGSIQIHRDPDLHAVITARAEKRMSRIVDQPGYAERVRRYVLDGAAPHRHDMEAVARALGLSARSLRRRLREEGVAFRDVIGAALGTRAKRLIADEKRPIEAAAYEMGFAHASAFHRAFKRWTGGTPAASRTTRT